MAHGGGARAQRAVLEQLQRAQGHAVIAAQVLLRSLCQPLFKGRGRGEGHLVVVPQGAAVFAVDLPNQAEHRADGQRGAARIVGLYGGDAPGQGVLGRRQKHLLILLIGIGLEHGVGPVAHQLGEDAVGLAVLIGLPGAAGKLGSAPADAHQLQHLTVHRDDMAADPLHDDGNVRGDPVQVPPCGQALIPLKQVLVPAHCLNAPLPCLGMGLQKGPADLYQMVGRAGGGDVRLGHADAHHQQVLVAVVEAGDDGFPAAVPGLHPGAQGQDVLVGAHRPDDAVLGVQSLGKHAPLHINLSVDECKFLHSIFTSPRRSCRPRWSSPAKYSGSPWGRR